MSIKKCVNGSFVNDVYREYGTDTDTFTTLPHEVIGDGQSNLTWSMDGNMQVSGTPTPQNPITPQECGEKTANLFDCNRTTGIIDNSYINKNTSAISTDNQYYISYPIPLEVGETYTWRFNDNSGDAHSAPTVGFYDSNDTLISVASHASTIRYFSFTVPNNCAYIRASVYKLKSAPTQAMLNVGSEPLDYEPYGYKIPISFGQGNYISYLAEPIRAKATADVMASTGTVTRAYKKVILDSSTYIEAYNASWGTAFSVAIANVSSGGEYASIDAICSHYPITTRNNIYRNNVNGISCSGSTNTVVMNDVDCSTVQAFKDFIVAQYNNGTPITIVIAVATPTTETFTAPTIPTSGSPQSFDVGTTLKPSEVSLTYHGWHEHSDTKYTNP